MELDSPLVRAVVTMPGCDAAGGDALNSALIKDVSMKDSMFQASEEVHPAELS